MNELSLFAGEVVTVASVRGYVADDGTLWLNAEDVARGWGFTDIKNGVEYVRWARMNSYLKEFGFSPQVEKDSFIPESMVYRLGFKASNEKAQKFQKVLAEEILPSIRKTGVYVAPNFKNPAEAARAWADLYEKNLSAQKDIKELKDENLVLTEKVSEMKPKADYTDLVLQSKSAIPITIIAKDYGMSAKKMNALLKELEIQYCVSGTWLLYAKHQGKGYTKTVTVPYNDGRNSAMHMKWTQKGRLFLYYELKNIGVLPNIEK